DEQVKQFETFRSLVDQARQAGKQVIVLSHIPEIDDPYVLAQDRYDAEVPESSSDKDPKNPRSVWSTWNVSAKVLDGWRDVLQSDTVIAVLAGHLHDSHKETYRRTYTWSTTDDRRLGFQKLYLAPPLAVKNQDTSPIQARGFSLVTLQPNHVNTLLYWYNPQTGEFTSDRTADNTRQSRTWWRSPNFLQRMWQLDQSDSPLIRLGILLIALLTAFLTVVAVWNIPAPVNPLASAGTTPAGNPKDASAPVNPSPFAGDFGKTVIAGFTGLAVTEVAKAIGGDPPTSASRWFYVVHFIFFFFLLLVLLSLIRAFVEGFRAIVAIPRYSLARPPLGQNRTPAQKVFDSVSYWFRRFIHWFFSLRVPVLTGADTLINLVQGKNQTMTRVFADTIIDQQRNIIRAADAIRKDLTTLIEHQLSSAASTSLGSPVRIGISVLSADQSSVFYISQSAGSAKLPFNKRSVAWVSVFTGAILWYEHKFHDDLNAYNKIVLFDNGSDTIAGDEKTILLASHYQPRQQEDYQAFVVLPLPWPQRGFGSDYVKGAIHISFRTDEEFEQIWKSAPPAGDPPVYPSGQRMLEPFVAEQLAESTGFCRHAEICAALTNSLTVLGELLRGFNEVIYRSYIEANPRD
ncbi:MAG: hypothetical protein JOZ32_21655, partial [Bryobacterales bacterium]|nr:hypothetical protein [Bryobacterales bacterium]